MSGIGRLPYEQRLARLGLTTLQVRRERGDMIEVYKIMTGKVDVQPSIWFTALPSREGAAGTRTNTGYLNLSRKKAKTETRLNQFSVRVVSRWNSLPNTVKSQPTLNLFKNAYDNLQN